MADETPLSPEVSRDLTARPRRYGVGLRAQIIVALTIGFALSVGLLGFAIARLGGRALDDDRRLAAETTADVLVAVAALSEGARRDAMRSVIDNDAIVGAEIDDGTSRIRIGDMAGGERITRTRAGVTATVVLTSAQSNTARTLPRLLLLYVVITAAAILVFTYVLLTRLIVRPVEELTRASEKIAAGNVAARASIHGGAEIARLAVSFNRMQSELARERSVLERRLHELEAATSELDAAQRSLVRSEKMASVGRLAAGIAHEIGNPLTSIVGLIELVQDGELEPDQEREFLGRVRKETERIHRIIRDLLDFARADPDPQTSELELFDMVEVVEDAVRLVGPQKDLSEVTIERRFADGCPNVRGSSSRFAQVVLNLVLNAADAIDEDGTIRLEVFPSDDADEVVLRVEDDGPGIEEALLDTLFEPFVTSKPTGEGTGLGLAVCHTLVEHMGGRLSATNTDHGARFEVALPAQRP